MVRGPELAWIKKKVCEGLGAWPRAFDALGGDERQLFLDLLDNANNGGQVNPSVVVYTSSMEPDECREMYGPLTGDAPEADSDEAAATTSAEESAAAEPAAEATPPAEEGGEAAATGGDAEAPAAADGAAEAPAAADAADAPAAADAEGADNAAADAAAEAAPAEEAAEEAAADGEKKEAPKTKQDPTELLRLHVCSVADGLPPAAYEVRACARAPPRPPPPRPPLLPRPSRPPLAAADQLRLLHARGEREGRGERHRRRGQRGDDHRP